MLCFFQSCLIAILLDCKQMIKYSIISVTSVRGALGYGSVSALLAEGIFGNGTNAKRPNEILTSTLEPGPGPKFQHTTKLPPMIPGDKAQTTKNDERQSSPGILSSTVPPIRVPEAVTFIWNIAHQYRCFEASQSFVTGE